MGDPLNGCLVHGTAEGLHLAKKVIKLGTVHLMTTLLTNGNSVPSCNLVEGGVRLEGNDGPSVM